MSIAVGYTLSSEEHAPGRLVDMAVAAESSGFDFVSISDHLHPWVHAQGHSPFVWSVLGAIAAQTERIEVGVGVTCPIVRFPPLLAAHAAATTACLMPGRFTFGVGSGEALNEHVNGGEWPAVDIRRAMLEEAVDVIRDLWTGERVTHRGEHFRVEAARIYDVPDPLPPIVVSAFGPQAAESAARCGDGLWTRSSADDVIDAWKQAGGTGPVYAQVNLCWAETVEEARRTAHEIWPNTGVPGQLSQDLPTPEHFEMAVENVTEDLVAESVACGPDPEPVLEQVQAAIDAGVDHVYLHQIGPDQDGFLDFWRTTLQDRIRSLTN